MVRRGAVCVALLMRRQQSSAAAAAGSSSKICVAAAAKAVARQRRLESGRGVANGGRMASLWLIAASRVGDELREGERRPAAVKQWCVGMVGWALAEIMA